MLGIESAGLFGMTCLICPFMSFLECCMSV
jgi:hypothetical protein